jgi:ParB-like chromosome segregation protein Spo0J
MRTITYDGTEYRCPFSTSFRRHTATELDAMRESIAAQGVLNPVRLYYDLDTDDAFCILDGEGRLTVAIELGAAVPFLDMGPLETEAAYAIAKTLNDARRHDDPAAIAARRAERVQRVAQARSEGESLRAIAEKEGVSHQQVARDLEEHAADVSTVTGVTVDKPAAPETVTGRDGKVRPATRKKPEPAPDELDFVDAAGQEVPKHLRDLFAPLFLVEVIDYLKQQQKVINDAKSWLHWLKPETHPTLAQLIRYLEDAIPHEVCRHCGGQMNGCIWCMTSGYHPRWSVEAGQNDADADTAEPEPQPEPPTKPGRGKRGAT